MFAIGLVVLSKQLARSFTHRQDYLFKPVALATIIAARFIRIVSPEVKAWEARNSHEATVRSKTLCHRSERLDPVGKTAHVENAFLASLFAENVQDASFLVSRDGILDDLWLHFVRTRTRTRGGPDGLSFCRPRIEDGSFCGRFGASKSVDQLDP